MKVWQLLPYVIGFVIGGVISGFIPGRSEVSRVLPLSNLEYHQQEEQRAACRRARVTFFEECMKGAEREYASITMSDCKVQWAALDSHVFDGDPRNYIADEIDCGKLK